MPIRSLLFVPLMCLVLAPPAADAVSCNAARTGCVSAAAWASRACQRNCERLGDKAAVATCRADCRSTRRAAEALCGDVDDPCAVACADGAISPNQTVFTIAGTTSDVNFVRVRLEYASTGNPPSKLRCSTDSGTTFVDC